VAVVQISRIQIRRGQKNQGEGVPQLASGELAWAIDSQELYIGNGSLSEGAPTVGNTKILTESDDIFTFSDSYSYKKPQFVQTGETTTNPIARSLQERLDDYVSVRAFGALGDGIQDATTIIQRAIDQLYLTQDNSHVVPEQSRVILYFDPGIYNITGTIYIPSYATIIGAGSEKTIIECSAGTAFKTVNDLSEVGQPAAAETTTYSNQCKNIKFAGLNIVHSANGIGLQLDNCRDSKFEDLSISGNWTMGNSITTIPTVGEPNDCGILLTCISATVQTNNNVFTKCKISGWSHGIIANNSILLNVFEKCQFTKLGAGINFGFQNFAELVPQHNRIKDCQFIDIHNEAIDIVRGNYNTSENNYFQLVGNLIDASNNYTSSETQSRYPVIKFADVNNTSVQDVFTRNRLRIAYLDSSVPFVEEIAGSAHFIDKHYEEIIIDNYATAQNLLRLPGEYDQTYIIHYYMSNEVMNFKRQGKITIMCEAYPNPVSVRISDNYDHFGGTDYDIGDTYLLQNITFSADFIDDGTIEIPKFSLYVKSKTGVGISGNTRFRFKIETHRFSF